MDILSDNATHEMELAGVDGHARLCDGLATDMHQNRKRIQGSGDEKIDA